jgi:regulator of cell morphogenesis and NO signaling
MPCPGLANMWIGLLKDTKKKYLFLDELQEIIAQLRHSFTTHLEQEENVIFPYIRQISHAYNSRESYASLLVRTLRKPVEDIIKQEHDTPPENACISQKVVFLKLKEADSDLAQHLHLENNILFPKAIAMEKELLEHKD